MIAKGDYYIDAEGRATKDPAKAEAQLAVDGHWLDDQIAKQWGFVDGKIPELEKQKASPKKAEAKDGENGSSVNIRRK